ncbi:hypothetical protein BDY24DRAFT_162440 [Mrakia frigida]|uniref:uncharacterized protein n=1 Tax=Mrakia frigida TaxID=29902 RepID=UPI003FCBFD96
MGSTSPPPPPPPRPSLLPKQEAATTPSPPLGRPAERESLPPSHPPSPRPPPNIPPHSRSSSSSSRDADKPDLSAVGRVLGAGEEDHIPKLGKVRCYWSLLTSDLEFLYLDPVLQHHMGAQHHSMLGTSLFSYLHPEELEQAKTDLKGIVDSGTLFGSVTRVRFARLPRIREILGCQDPEFAARDANLYIADDHYLALDLVLNAAGEGLILAFFHAIVDKDEAQDKDESKKSEWTNWCGTPFITTDMVKLLWDQVDSVPRAKPPVAPAFRSSRLLRPLPSFTELLLTRLASFLRLSLHQLPLESSKSSWPVQNTRFFSLILHLETQARIDPSLPATEATRRRSSRSFSWRFLSTLRGEVSSLRSRQLVRGGSERSTRS